MPDILFNYMYRDGSNYKNHGSVVLANPDNLTLVVFEAMIKSRLIEEQWFVATEWGVTDLHFDHWLEDDHGWHEFVNVEFVDETPAP